jgi:hypothetical protein
MLRCFFKSTLLKKLALISFLIIIFLSQCGYYCFCAFQVFQAKEAAREQRLKEIPENLLTKIRIIDNDRTIQWEEEGKEFQVDGEMYDVVKTKFEDGIQYMFCLADKKEDLVLAALEKLIRSNADNAAHQGKYHSAAKIMIPDWVLELQTVTSPCQNAATSAKEYFTYKDSLVYSFIEINSPPPDLNFKPNT